jgi:hypothetical protein
LIERVTQATRDLCSRQHITTQNPAARSSVLDPSATRQEQESPTTTFLNQTLQSTQPTHEPSTEQCGMHIVACHIVTACQMQAHCDRADQQNKQIQRHPDTPKQGLVRLTPARQAHNTMQRATTCTRHDNQANKSLQTKGTT